MKVSLVTETQDIASGFYGISTLVTMPFTLKKHERSTSMFVHQYFRKSPVCGLCIHSETPEYVNVIQKEERTPQAENGTL